ncbi:hypothetical protein [Flagellimonas onchidii]|uniref:hypothetical protein n=1 Tax=Flagellimonas onchidii TaxID=2562684 RepID=UPI0010A68C21|nr:hypothetical protein [Allomuricauda onchidii]
MEENIYREIESKGHGPRYTYLMGDETLLGKLRSEVDKIREQNTCSHRPYAMDFLTATQMYSHEVGDIDENALVLSYVHHNYHKKKNDMVSMEVCYLELREYFLDLKNEELPPFDQ